MKKRIVKSTSQSRWKWYSGGGVIAVAVVLGCASAVEFKESGFKPPVAPTASRSYPTPPAPKTKRGVAASPGFEVPHNGGKVRMPVSVSFDGDSIVTVSSDRSVLITISAEADIANVRGSISGAEGLAGHVDQPLDFTQIAAGETRAVEVNVPARTGSVVVQISGVVGGMSMSSSFELKVVNPKDPGAVRSSKTSSEADSAVSRDSSGQLVQPMRAD